MRYCSLDLYFRAVLFVGHLFVLFFRAELFVLCFCPMFLGLLFCPMFFALLFRPVLFALLFWRFSFRLFTLNVVWSCSPLTSNTSASCALDLPFVPSQRTFGAVLYWRCTIRAVPLALVSVAPFSVVLPFWLSVLLAVSITLARQCEKSPIAPFPA